jgi:hypothetical protein
MNKRSIFCSFVAAIVCSATLGSAQAQPKTVRVPGTDSQIAFGPQPTAATMRVIVNWLADNFELPRDYSYPNVRREPAWRVTALRHTGLLLDSPREAAPMQPGQREVVAAYDPETKTILLPERWSGSTPTELSILVHEMVHHLQYVAGNKYDCVEAREGLAYAAQDKWLHLFKRDLAKDFEIDGFTLLVITTCHF